MAAALVVMSAHAADPAQPAPAAKPEAAAPANDAAAQNPAEDALSAMAGPLTPAEKPAAGADAAPATKANPATTAPAQGLAAGSKAAAPADKPAEGAGPAAAPAAAAAQARQAPTRAPEGNRVRQTRSDGSGGRYAGHGEGRKPATEGADGKPGATQQIDWSARRAERQAKRAASQGNAREARHSGSHRQPAADAAE